MSAGKGLPRELHICLNLKLTRKLDERHKRVATANAASLFPLLPLACGQAQNPPCAPCTTCSQANMGAALLHQALQPPGVASVCFHEEHQAAAASAAEAVKQQYSLPPTA
eukprot:1156532-Pelagomonas_calceolata.AAC.18